MNEDINSDRVSKLKEEKEKVVKQIAFGAEGPIHEDDGIFRAGWEAGFKWATESKQATYSEIGWWINPYSWEQKPDLAWRWLEERTTRVQTRNMGKDETWARGWLYGVRAFGEEFEKRFSKLDSQVSQPKIFASE
jgi:hypothetical protein